jgi:hypothetical protein
MKKFTIGCDPEFFLREKDSGNIVSAVGIIGGTKDVPKKITDICSVHEDNVALEITVPPSNSKVEFVNTVEQAVKDAVKLIKSKYSLAIISSNEFPISELQSKGAKEFGCSSDYDAFDDSVNIPPSPENTNYRSCGGHIHIGHDKVKDKDYNKHLVLLLDILLGLPSLFLDEDSKRRTLYGKASCYRFKDFGIEYRVLSNFWTKNSDLIGWVYDSVALALEYNERGVSLSDSVYEKTRIAINTNDKKLAKEIMDSLLIKIPEFN